MALCVGGLSFTVGERCSFWSVIVLVDLCPALSRLLDISCVCLGVKTFEEKGPNKSKYDSNSPTTRAWCLTSDQKNPNEGQRGRKASTAQLCYSELLAINTVAWPVVLTHRETANKDG